MNRNEEAFNHIKDEVRRNGLVLKFLSNDFKRNKEIVMLAVTDNGLALQYASEHLKADLDVIKAAMIEDKDAIKYAIFNDQVGWYFLRLQIFKVGT